MLAVPKGRIVSALLLLWMLPRLTHARPADVPLRKALTPPPQESEVIPRGQPRPLSRREIFQAIQNDLAQKGIAGREELRPGDLRIQSSAPVIKDDMGLQVKRIGFDPIRRELVFELWASHAPQYLPFEVTSRRDPQSLGLTSWSGWKSAEAGGEPWAGSPMTTRGVNRAHTKAPVLAKPGRPVTLVMFGQNVRITTTVVPLQPGSKGQSILVRDPATGRVMTAEVVDDGQLRSSF